MSVEQERLKEIIAAAAAKSAAVERDAYLDAACQGDAQLRAKVEGLLKAHEAAGDFLEQTVRLPSLMNDLVVERAGAMIGRYKLLQEIGEGGFGRVFMAEQIEPLHRKVALKIIKAGMDTREVVARFESERQALALMDHPNIARVLDAGATDSGRPYFVMELVKGIPITVYCDRHNLPMLERLQLFMQVCHAVQHAHQKGIIHRDLKPTNIMVALIDGKPVPKIIDFGIAKALAQKLTEKTLFTAFDQIIGTPAYMSPEQAALSGVDVDTRSDIYSLGVLLYELLTGATPFDDETFREAALDEVRRIIRETEPAKPSTRLRTLGDKLTEVAQHRHTEPSELTRLVHGDLDWIVMKALEKDRARRYETAGALVEDLQRHLDHQPVHASPPGAVYRARKFVRRHRMGVAMAASVTLALIAGLIFAVLGFMVAKQERDRALISEAAAESGRREAENQRTVALKSLYCAKIRLAHHAWRAGQAERVLQLLKETRPAPGEPDLRGWEWYYLLSACHRAAFTLWGHTGQVRSVSWSADGQRLASAGEDSTVRIWNTQTGQGIGVLRGHTKPVLCVAWSPDGLQAASLSYDNSLRVWDVASRQQVLVMGTSGLRGGWSSLPYYQNSVKWSPDGSRLALPEYESTVIYDARTGHELMRLPQQGREVISLEWSSDGRHLASGEFITDGTDGRTMAVVRVWDTASGSQLEEISASEWSAVNSLAWSSDGRYLAAGLDRELLVWDASTWEEVVRRAIHQGNVLSVAWSPTGTLASAGRDGTIRILNLDDAERVITICGHTDSANSVAWGADGRRLASASLDGSVRIWDVGPRLDAFDFPGGSTGLDAFESPGGLTVAWRPGGHVLARGGVDWVELLDTEAWSHQITFHEPLGLESPAWDSTGNYLATACTKDRSVKVMDVDHGREIFRAQSQSVWGWHSVAWRPNAQQLAVGGLDHNVHLWDVATTNELLTLSGHGRIVHSVAWHPTGRRLASASYGPEVIVWDIDRGSQLLRLLREPTRVWGNCGLAWNPAGDRLAVGNSQGEVLVWDTDTGAEVLRLRRHTGEVRDVSWSPDGGRLASASAEGNVKIWDMQSGRELLTLPEYVNPLMLSWSPDGQMLAGASGWTRVWDARFGYELEQKIQTSTSDLAREDLRETIVSLFLRGKSTAAASLSRSAREVQGKPQSASACHNLGSELCRQGFVDQAVSEFLEAIELDPAHADAWHALGSAYARQGHWAKAESAYRGALRHKPDFVSAQTALVNSLVKQRKGSEAMEAYEEAVRVLPQGLGEQIDLAMPLNNLAWLLATCGNATVRDGSNAVDYAERAVAAAGRTNSNYLDTLAAAYAELGQFTNAIRVQQEAIRLLDSEQDKTDYETHLRLYQSGSPIRD